MNSGHGISYIEPVLNGVLFVAGVNVGLGTAELATS